jgi:hypothetical protein
VKKRLIERNIKKKVKIGLMGRYGTIKKNRNHTYYNIL